MADIVINYQYMESVVQKLGELKAAYAKAAGTFQTDFKSATGEWTGLTKNAVNAFVTGTVNTYMATTVPSVIQGLSDLLQANIDQFSDADKQISENIPK